MEKALILSSWRTSAASGAVGEAQEWESRTRGMEKTVMEGQREMLMLSSWLCTPALQSTPCSSSPIPLALTATPLHPDTTPSPACTQAFHIAASLPCHLLPCPLPCPLPSMRHM